MAEYALSPITSAEAGCWLAGSSNRSADELNRDTIRVAIFHSWPIGESDVALLDEIDARWPEESSWSDDSEREGYTDSEALTEMAYEAIDYLNSIAPEGYFFAFDDGLYMYAEDDENEWSDPR